VLMKREDFCVKNGRIVDELKTILFQ
jgi:hypothetical protein